MNTVGYAESEDRFEFMKGAEIALDKVLKIATTELQDYSRTLSREREEHERTRQDIVTLAEILRKYTDE